MGAFFSHRRTPPDNSQTMEESKPHSTNESFSYKWLMDMKKPVTYADYPKNTLGFLLDLEDHSRISKKCVDRSSFHFEVPAGSGPTDMSVADLVIHNGSLVPLNLINQRNNEIDSNLIPEDSILFQPASTDASKLFRTQYRRVDPKHPITAPHSSPMCCSAKLTRDSNNGMILRDTSRKLRSFQRTKKPPKRIVILKYIKSLLHFCKKIKEFGSNEVRPVSPRPNDDASFQTKSGCSSPLYDVGRERAISEAILYCKSSSKKSMESFEVDQDEGSHKYVASEKLYSLENMRN